MKMSTKIKLGFVGGLAAFAMILAAANIYVVDEGDRVLVVRLGNVDRVEGPGLRIKTPFVESKYTFSVRIQPGRFEEQSAYTSDNQVVTGDLLVPYQIDENAIELIYTKYGANFEGRLMTRLINGAFREALGQINTITLALNREKIGHQIGERLMKELEPFGIIVSAGNVKLSGINFSKAFDARIASALHEKAAVEKARQTARRKEQEAFAERARAKGIADARREKADGEAYYQQTVAKGQARAIRLKADADAHAIAAKGAAEAGALAARGKVIADRPELATLIRAEASLRWDGKLPTRYIPNSAFPILDVGK